MAHLDGDLDYRTSVRKKGGLLLFDFLLYQHKWRYLFSNMQ